MADSETHQSGFTITAQSLESKPIDSASEELKQPSIRDIIIAGLSFTAFLTILVFAMNAIGVEKLRELIANAGIFAPLLYIVIKALTYIFAPLTSGPIQLVAAPLFGNIWLGTLYTLIGEVLGGSISFWIARRFGRPIVLRALGKNGMKQVDEFYKQRINNWVILAAARLILFSVWDFLSYAIGLAKSVRFSTYIIVSTFVGVVPTLFFVWIGSEAIKDTQALIMIYGLIVALVLVPIVARHQIEALLKWLSKGAVVKDG